MTQEVDIKVQDGVQVMRLLRADKKNALTGPMYDAMSAALDASETNDDIAAHVFIGSGGVFTAGNDINDFMRRASDGSQDVAPSQMFIQRLPKVSKPMIAAVDGLAIGIGTTMLLHCDLVYASEQARLHVPFVSLGLVPEAASSLLLPRRVGHALAAEMILLGVPLAAARAREVGLVNAIVPAAELRGHALARATDLARQPPQALRLSRALLRGDRSDVDARIAEEATHFAACLAHPEAREALTAFVQRRTPDFSTFE
jgi:enoyl-CoA hydratase/carnithine racemase